MLHWRVRELSCEENNQLNVLYHFRNWPVKLVVVSLLPVFGDRVSVTFHLMFVHIICSSVATFWEELFTRLVICSLCILTICINLVISRFGFEGGVWILIAPVPGNCIPTLGNKVQKPP